MFERKNERCLSEIESNAEKAFKTLIINTYLPTDPRKDDFDETELLILLSDIASIIDENACDQVVWTGDINADFRRNTRFVSTIEEFVSNMGLQKSWEKFSADFTHMAERDGVTHTSIIDHFFWNQQLDKNVTDAGVIHLPENMSDHCPVFCKYKMSNTQQKRVESVNLKDKVFPSWRKASEEQKSDYSEDVKTSLERIDVPVHLMCRNVHCKETSHKVSTDQLMYDILSAIENSAKKNMSTSKKQQCKSKIPDWKDDIEPFRENAHFWHAIWISAGRPINCQLHEIMKK